MAATSPNAKDRAECLHVLNEIVALLAQAQGASTALTREMFQGLLADDFELRDLEWSIDGIGKTEIIVKDGEMIRIDFVTARDEYPFSARFRRVCSGRWCLIAFLAACPGCFGDGVLDGKTCPACDGAAFVGRMPSG